MKKLTVSIIGLGLIGGSVAKALRSRKPDTKINVADVDESCLHAALSDGIADNALLASSACDIPDEFLLCDIIYFCLPVSTSRQWLMQLSDRIPNTAVVTDVCSVKGGIMQTAKKHNILRFIGGHPMAGSEKSGYAGSSAFLFENAYYVLTPPDIYNPSDLKLLHDIALSFGSMVIETTSKAHDAAVATVSHLPHIVSASLVNMISGVGLDKALAAGGFKDITRISSSSPHLWADISLENRSELLECCNEYKNRFDEFIYAISNNDSPLLQELFLAAKTTRDSLPSRTGSLIPRTFEIKIDVEDKPGAIVLVSTILANEDINIKNINIENNREYTGGTMTVTLADEDSCKKGVAALILAGLCAKYISV